MNKLTLFVFQFLSISFICHAGPTVTLTEHRRTHGVPKIAQLFPSVESIYFVGMAIWHSFKNTENKPQEIKPLLLREKSYEEMREECKEKIKKLEQEIAEASYLVQKTGERSIDDMRSELRELQENLYNSNPFIEKENQDFLEPISITNFRKAPASGSYVVPGILNAPRSESGTESSSADSDEEADAEYWECDEAVTRYQRQPTVQNRLVVERFAERGWIIAKIALLKNEIAELNTHLTELGQDLEEAKIELLDKSGRRISAERVGNIENQINNTYEELAIRHDELQTLENRQKTGQYKYFEPNPFDEFLDDDNDQAAAPIPATARTTRIEILRRLDAIINQLLDTNTRLVLTRAQLTYAASRAFFDQIRGFLNTEITRLQNMRQTLLDPTVSSKAKSNILYQTRDMDPEHTVNTSGLLSFFNHYITAQNMRPDLLAELTRVNDVALRIVRRYTDGDDAALILRSAARDLEAFHDPASPRMAVVALRESERYLLRALDVEEFDAGTNIETYLASIRTRANTYTLWLIDEQSLPMRVAPARIQQRFAEFLQFAETIWRASSGQTVGHVQAVMNARQDFFAYPDPRGYPQTIWVHQTEHWAIRVRRNKTTGRWQLTVGFLRQHPYTANGQLREPIIRDPNNTLLTFRFDTAGGHFAPRGPNEAIWEHFRIAAARFGLMGPEVHLPLQ